MLTGKAQPSLFDSGEVRDIHNAFGHFTEPVFEVHRRQPVSWKLDRELLKTRSQSARQPILIGLLLVSLSEPFLAAAVGQLAGTMVVPHRAAFSVE